MTGDQVCRAGTPNEQGYADAVAFHEMQVRRALLMLQPLLGTSRRVSERARLLRWLVDAGVLTSSGAHLLVPEREEVADDE